MAQCFLLCLILVNAFVAVVASENANFQHPPAPAPYKAEAPVIRKLGRHEPKVVRTIGGAPAPHTDKNVPATAGGSPPTTEQNTGATSTTEGSNNEGNVSSSVEGQSNIHPEEKRHHSSTDKSVAGGGVILGGLATTFLVAVFCYIRATGRHKSDTHQSTSEVAN